MSKKGSDNAVLCCSIPAPTRGHRAEKVPDPCQIGLLGGTRSAGPKVSAHFLRLAGRESAVDQVLDPLPRFPALHILTLPGTLVAPLSVSSARNGGATSRCRL